MAEPNFKNRLYYGDNLDILRNPEYFPHDCVDLIYLDPPFNSNRNYNVLFKSESGADSEAQITAFEDTWHWGITAEDTYRDLITGAPPKVAAAIAALLDLIDRNQMMAYLVMMAARLVELHRVLKPTGSLYLHCDPTASHYLKILLDAIFGVRNFRNEIAWCYTGPGNTKRWFPRKHDTIFFYAKSKKTKFNRDAVRIPYRNPHNFTMGGSGSLTKGKKSGDYKTGLKEQLTKGKVVEDYWIDVPSLSVSKERLGYPTQKPVKLLERIIRASSNEGDIVLDPFCGCGTAIAAAHKLNRKWIGIDITHLSIALQKYRLGDMFGLTSGADYAVIGEPRTVAGARALATDSDNEGRYQFEWWALSLIQAKPIGGRAGSRRGKKGADKGIDGVINFFEPNRKGKAKAQKVVVQVKSGKVKSGDIRDLKGTVERERAAIGVFITLELPTQDMLREALAAGYYESPFWKRPYRKLQILTVGDLLDGAIVSMPPQHGTFERAEFYKPDQTSREGKSQKGLFKG